ncbi:MAG: Zn-ribbon domain-containing OB-fold protein [Deltaproteobacteria bacterium]|nr:Zn-ribbon domain-containing OB-fold protein [Deltaproteobacteria bacterium]MCL5276650.1 Zn-ribbon domain-containing OB-fold protein [Deltaproteobacteria bacterium]
MDIQEAIRTYTRKAVSYYGDAQNDEFFRRLKQKEFVSLRCTRCGKVMFPPRPVCPECHSGKLEWVDLPRTGTLYAFTQQEKAFRFSAPDVIGLVELEGVGRITTKIKGNFEQLVIDMRVELEFLELDDGSVVHQFRPAGQKK